MSIVNQLSYSQRRRDRMVNNRNGFTYAANITVLVLALILFVSVPNPVTVFSILTCIALGIGFCTTMFYVMTIKELPLSKKASEMEEQRREKIANELEGSRKEIKKQVKGGKQWSDWIKEG